MKGVADDKPALCMFKFPDIIPFRVPLEAFALLQV